jgi:hypothetical protein
MTTKEPHLLATLTLLSALLLNQCAPTESPESKTHGGASVVTEHWTKVSSRPPTFYPRGVAADCSTDYQSGDWVETGDAVGTRFFIPLACPGGLPRQALVNEALSARRPGELHPGSEETRKLEPKEVIGRAAMTPIWMVGWLASFGRWPGYDVDWREEWKSSKQPPNKKRGRPPGVLTEDGKTKPQTHNLRNAIAAGDS